MQENYGPSVLMHPCEIEEILHFTCSNCHCWWSMATMDRARPRKIHCPHCGEFNLVIYNERPPNNIVRDTQTIKGRGVYAYRAFRKDEIVECSPVIILKTLPSDELKFYTYEWGQEYAIALGHGTLFNHHNPANLRYEHNYNAHEIQFYAVHDIREGEELTINYNSNGESTWPDDSWFVERNIKPI